MSVPATQLNPMPPYQESVDAVIAALGTDSRRGLSEAEARTRLAREGRNELTAEEPMPAWRKFLAQFTDVLVILLLIATAISDPLGVGSPTSLAMAVFGEVVCALLVALGLFTRFAAAVLAITMATAFFLVHKAALSGPGSGELAFVYLAGWVALLVAGAGRFSLDAKMGGRAST